MDPHVAHLQARYAAGADALAALRDRVRAVLPEVVRVLVAEFGARRVVLFGSIADGRMSAEPDLDLLVEGIAPERLGAAAGRLFLMVPVPVDLVPLETARSEVVARALAEGLPLHG